LFLPVLFGFIMLFSAPRAAAQLKNLPIKVGSKAVFWPVPAVSFSPETSWSFGGSLVLTGRPDPDKLTNVSFTQLDLRYTLNKQFIADIDHYVFLGDRWIFSGSNSYYNYPEKYFASFTDKPAGEIYFSKRIEFENKLFFRVSENLFFGPAQRFQYIWDLEYEYRGDFYRDHPTGFNGGLSNGLGFGLLMDRRDNQLNPSAGSKYFQTSILDFSQFIGSDFNFTRLELDGRYYVSTFRNQVLALQAYLIVNGGDPPFRLTGLMGGARIMRGYYFGSYRDRQLVVLQAELRTKIHKWFGFAAFVGIGQVSDHLSRMLSMPPKLSFGGGLRIMIDQANQANLRIDYAVGSGSSGWYISYGEAF